MLGEANKKKFAMKCLMFQKMKFLIFFLYILFKVTCSDFIFVNRGKELKAKKENQESERR